MQHFADTLLIFLALHFGTKADTALFRAITNNLVQPGKRATTNEQNIAGIHLQEFLLGMLAATLRWNRSNRTFDQFQQRLLHTFPGDITGNRRVVRLAGNFVDFINIDNTGLRLLDIVVTFLQQLLDNIFDILTHITGFGQGGRIGNRERYIQQPRQGFSQQGFTATGRTNQQNVTLGQFDIIFFLPGFQTLVMVIDRHRKHLFGTLLADHIFVEDILDFVRGRQ